MHQGMWSVRRAFFQGLKVQRHLMDRWDVTPGRFNMMFAIRCQRVAWFPQRKLRELLGVCASTISRMIDSLVDKGLLVKRSVDGDTRCNELALTKHGKRTVRCMFDNLIKSGLARRIVGHLLGDDPDTTPSDDDITHINEQFLGRMSVLRMNLEDLACFDYGHGPVDECRMPEPAEIVDLREHDRSCWPANAAVLTWVARL